MTSNRRVTQEEMPRLEVEAKRALIDEILEKHYIARQEGERKLRPGTLFAEESEVNGYLAALARDNGMTLPQLMQRVEAANISVATVREQARILVSWQHWISGYYGQRVRVSDDDAELRLRELQSQASRPQYLISEIFIDAEKVGSMQAAMDQAQSLVDQLQQQGRFEPVAFQYSSLPSAAKGGDAGWLSTNQMAPEIAAVIDGLRPGFVTRPIATQKGVYLVLLREKRTGSTSTLVNLKQIAVPLAAGADAATAQTAQTRLVSLKGQIKGCDTMEQVARSNGLQVGDLGQADTKDLNPQIRTVVEGLQPNQVSDPVRMETSLHLIALCSRAPSGVTLPTVEQIKNDMITDRLVNIATRELRNLHNSATIREP